MATLYIKYAKKCEKMFFFPNYKWAWFLLARAWLVATGYANAIFYLVKKF